VLLLLLAHLLRPALQPALQPSALPPALLLLPRSELPLLLLPH
jgi:hypothetical protein